ncbi:subtilisin-like protein [Mollisia scopiformis]|uniref:Subtilisin-like protein n=1 Tax=Mollisia scopiformis TaxID=149040 RepID=A0A194XEX5_MOLSC|nr:subtilisin-like protein [Mollisia scopiformis]KUJ18701.1 subtilisin-like protein [Mollisia scopiformis]
MHLSSTLSLVFILPLIYAFPFRTQQIGRAAQDVRPGNYILRYHDYVSDADVLKHEAIIQAKLGIGCTTIYNFNTFKGCHLETDPAGLQAVASPLILSSEPDSLFSISPRPAPLPPVTVRPNSSISTSSHDMSTETGAPWGLGRISHKKAGNSSYVFDASACAGTTIYVIDTGIRITHVEFGGRARYGASFVTGVVLPADDHGHGTHVSGTAAGSSVGVCHGAEVVAVKVLDSTGFGYNTWIIAGIQWAVNVALSRSNTTRQSVISISIGGGYSPTLNAAVTAAVAAGLPVSVAAGNNGEDSSLFSPSSAVNAMIVGATDISDNKAYFSNYDKGVSIWVPGVDVLSAFNTCDQCYFWYSGTSQATPHVAGLAAYLMTLDDLSTPSKILSKIRSLATNRLIVGSLGGSSNKLAYNGNGA